MITNQTPREFCICRWHLTDPIDESQMLSAAGVNLIETGSSWLRDEGEDHIARARDILLQGGIRIRSIHSPFGEKEDLTSLDSTIRGEALNVTMAIIEKARAAGAELLVVHPGHACPEEDIPKKEALLPEVMKKLVPFAERAKVVLALENLLPNHPCCRCETLAQIVDDLNSPWVRICFDSGHAHVTGDVLSELKACGSRILSYHLHDNDGTRDQHIQPPYGTIPWDGIFTFAEEETPDLPITVEAGPWGKGDYSWMLEELKALSEGRAWFPSILGRDQVKIICTSCGHIVFRRGEDLVCLCTPMDELSTS